MKAKRSAEAQTLLRPLLLPIFRYLYRLSGVDGRTRLRKLPGVSALFRILNERLLRPPLTDNGLVEAKINGLTMYASPDEISGGFFLGEYEPATSFIFRALVGEGDVVVDVGANWGYFSILAATLCGAGGTVFAFEPHPQNLALLLKNIAANQLRNVQAVQKAVSNQTGKAKLLLSQSGVRHSLHFLPEAWRAPAGAPDSMTVDTVTLDDFFAGRALSPKLIKMDIEGAEPLAVAGMRGLMERNQDLALITEFLPGHLGRRAAEDFLNEITALGFELVIIDDGRYQLMLGFSVPQALKWAEEQTQLTNLLWVRGQALRARLLGDHRSSGGGRGAPRTVRW